MAQIPSISKLLTPFFITLIEFMQKIIQPPARAKEKSLSRSPGHISRTFGLFLDYTPKRTQLLDNYLNTFQIVQKLSRSSTLLLDYLDTFSRLIGHF